MKVPVLKSEKADQQSAKPEYPDRPDPLYRLRLPVRVEEIKNKGDTDMQKKYWKRLLSCILCIVLIVAMALVTTGCSGIAGKQDSQTENGASESGTWPDGSVIGEGSKQFTLTVTDGDGSETKLEIHTDAETVGAALSELGVIDGDEGEYGLYVKTVNGLTADYDKDGMYWALYIHGEYAQTGVDSTEITGGESYSFKMEKA